MWIRGLGDVFFNGSTTTGPWALNYFDTDTGQFEHVAGPNGEVFTPGPPRIELGAQAFGLTLVGGALEGDNTGDELYSLSKEGTVRLFADVTAGPASSWFRPASEFTPFSESDYFIATLGGYSEPVVIYSDGESEPLANFFSTIDSMLLPEFHGVHEGEHVITAAINGVTVNDWPAKIMILVDLEAGTFRTINDFDRPVGNFEVKSVYLVEDRLFSDISTTNFGSELWELVDGTWELIDDVSPGAAGSRPRYAFSEGGRTIFICSAIQGTRSFNCKATAWFPFRSLGQKPVRYQTLWRLNGRI